MENGTVIKKLRNFFQKNIYYFLWYYWIF